MSVYISFHPTDPAVFGRDSVQVDRFLFDEFGTRSQLVFSSENQLEFVYRIRKPVPANEPSQRKFFVSLASTLENFRALRPHFTQIEVDAK